MAFTTVPKESRNKVNTAGEILAQDNPDPSKSRWAIDLADRWRACHAYPINTFQATLRTRLRAFRGDPIAAQRLKRMPTIIDKLRRYPTMKLTQMQDIGGVRAILGSIRQVYALTEQYITSGRFFHELIGHKDYIRSPRSEDGYRSVHLIYRYRNRRAPAYDGLQIELQIRTRIQHIWATAVESMGTFLGQALKSRQGDRDWLDFFALVSSAFAFTERQPLVPRYADLSKKDTFARVSEVEERLGALDLMRGLSIAADAIYRSQSSSKGWFYHLIVLNSLERRVDIRSYDRESFNEAMNDYGEVEAEAATGDRIEPVLVSAGPMDKLRRAYPNFFLDIGDFARMVSAIVAEARK